MRDQASLRRRAVALMREAIALLDEAHDDKSAVHLHAAIDMAEQRHPLQPGDELPDENFDPASSIPPPADSALVRAMGGALAMFATLLARSGIIEIGEVANLLGIYAVATSEEDAAEGLILGCWAAMLRDLAEQQNDKATARMPDQ